MIAFGSWRCSVYPVNEVLEYPFLVQVFFPWMYKRTFLIAFVAIFRIDTAIPIGSKIGKVVHGLSTVLANI